MKLVLLSDVHLSWDNPIARKDNLFETQFKKLNFVFDWATDNNANILQAGDLFHRPRSWYLLPVMIDFLKNHSAKLHCVFGQHDTYLYSEDIRKTTSLGILAKLGLVDILDMHLINEEGVLIVGCSYGKKIPEIEDFGESDPYCKILVIHAPISDAPLYPGHELTYARNFLRLHNEYDLILCGDIHKAFIYGSKGRYIVNTGPMLRRECNEYNFKHKPHFLVYDTKTKTLEDVTIPHEPADKVLTREHIERVDFNDLMLQDFIKSVETGEVKSASFTDNLRIFIEKNDLTEEVVNILSKVMEDKDV